MPDPLAGQRERINTDRDLHTITWPDRGRGCPVAVGDTFKLRTCEIEIIRRRRVRQGSRFSWVADFVRSYPDRGRRLLTSARRKGDGLDEHYGYTRDPELAMRACDDPDAATIAPLDSPRNVGPPPEPEAVPPHEVKTLPSSVAARARFESQRRDEAVRRMRRSLIEEIREELGPEEVERVREFVGELRR